MIKLPILYVEDLNIKELEEFIPTEYEGDKQEYINNDTEGFFRFKEELYSIRLLYTEKDYSFIYGEDEEEIKVKIFYDYVEINTTEELDYMLKLIEKDKNNPFLP